MAARKRYPTLGNPLGARIEMAAKPQQPPPPPQPPQPRLSHSPASATAAAAAAADASQASIDNIVTAVRLFSESLLTNRVSKEAQQEVKALAAQMEVLIARRRLSDSRSRSPSAAETRLALRNLKRFLEREAVRERAAVASGGKLQCVSCTTDTLESSCGSRIQAFSSVSDRTQSPSTNSADEEANSVCSEGRGSGGRGDGRPVPPATGTATIVEKMRLRCCLQHQHSHSQSPPPLAADQPQPKSKQKRSRKKPQPPPSLPPSPPPRELLGPSRQVELTCSEQPLFLLQAPDLLEDTVESSDSAANTDIAHFDQVHLATEFVELNPSESNDCEVIREFQSQPLSLLMMKLHPPARVERGPLTAANPQLDELQQPKPPPPPQRGLEVAVEQLAFYEPVMLLTAEPACGGSWCTSCCRYAIADKALVAEQGNQNCASVGLQQPIPGAISWTARTVTTAAVTAEVTDASNEQLAKEAVNKIVSTCSCPSDSDARRAEDNKDTMDKNKEPMEESEEDIQDSSALLPEQQQSTKVARQHVGLQATPVVVVQRVCESSSSPERLVSSGSLLALMSSGAGGGGGSGGCESVEDISWQQPLFRIVDLVRQVRLAAPMTRSRSPPIVADPLNYVDEDVIDVGESNSTMEVLDQSGETDKAAARPLAQTWSSCEFGQSSGFTKLLLTLDKAAKRRREQALARRQRHKKQRQQLSTLSPPTPSPPLQQSQLRSSRKLKSSRHSRRTSRSGNNSSCRHLRCQPPSPPAPSVSLRSLSEAMRHQQVALRQAAKSLSGLSCSLRQCVQQVQDAANAVNSSL